MCVARRYMLSVCAPAPIALLSMDKNLCIKAAISGVLVGLDVPSVADAGLEHRMLDQLLAHASVGHATHPVLSKEAAPNDYHGHAHREDEAMQQDGDVP